MELNGYKSQQFKLLSNKNAARPWLAFWCVKHTCKKSAVSTPYCCSVGIKLFLHPFTVQMCLIFDSQNASRHEAKNKFGNLRLFEKMSFCRFIVLEYFETKALLSTVSFISNVAAAIGTNNILRLIKDFLHLMLFPYP